MFEPLAAPDSFPQSAARRHGACLRDRRESSKHPTPYVSNPGRRDPSLQESHPPRCPPVPLGGSGAGRSAAEVRAGTRVFKIPTPLPMRIFARGV